MKTRKLLLKAVVNGEKTIIGEAVVDTEDGYLDISATITDPQWRKILIGEPSFSVQFEPNRTAFGEPPGFHIKELSVSTNEATTIRARGDQSPYDRFADGAVRHASKNERRKGR